MARHSLNPMRAANDDPRLGPAEQLVTAGHDQVRTRVDRLRERRLRRQPEAGRIQQGAAAEVLEQRQSMFACQHCQFGCRCGMDKPERPEVAGMDLQVGRGLPGGGRDVVPSIGPVRGADLDQARSRLAEYIRHTESAADLDGLSPRHHDLFAGRHGREHQQYRRRTVVHHQRGLGAGQRPQEPGDLAHAAAALVALRFDLEGDRMSRHRPHRLGGLRAHRRAAEIGVDDDSGGVQDRDQPWPLQCADCVPHAPLDLPTIEPPTMEHFLTHVVKLSADDASERLVGETTP